MQSKDRAYLQAWLEQRLSESADALAITLGVPVEDVLAARPVIEEAAQQVLATLAPRMEEVRERHAEEQRTKECSPKSWAEARSLWVQEIHADRAYLLTVVDALAWQVGDLTADRDSESRWAAQYLAERDEARRELAEMKTERAKWTTVGAGMSATSPLRAHQMLPDGTACQICGLPAKYITAPYSCFGRLPTAEVAGLRSDLVTARHDMVEVLDVDRIQLATARQDRDAARATLADVHQHYARKSSAWLSGHRHALCAEGRRLASGDDADAFDAHVLACAGPEPGQAETPEQG